MFIDVKLHLNTSVTLYEVTFSQAVCPRLSSIAKGVQTIQIHPHRRGPPITARTISRDTVTGGGWTEVLEPRFIPQL